MCFIQVCIKEVWLYERKAHRDPSKTTMMCLFITHKLSFSTVWMCSAKDCRFLCVWRIYITIQHKMEVTVFQKRKTGIGNYSLHFLFMFPSQCGYLKHKTYKAHDMFDISEQQCCTAWHVPSLSFHYIVIVHFEKVPHTNSATRQIIGFMYMDTNTQIFSWQCNHL